MGTMAKVMMMLSMMSLMGASSCGTVTRKIICKQIKTAAIKPLPLCDISFQFNRCRCRCFDFNNWKTLPLAQCPQIMESLDPYMSFEVVVEKGDEGKNFPIEYCEGVAGFYVEDHASELRPKIKELATIRSDYCE